jgi:hypothetical protein
LQIKIAHQRAAFNHPTRAFPFTKVLPALIVMPAAAEVGYSIDWKFSSPERAAHPL